MKCNYKYYGWISVLLFVLCGIACDGRQDADRWLNRADSLLAEHPDSALRLLQSRQAVRLPGRARQARFALLLAQATNKCYLPLAPCDSLLEAAIDYYGEPVPQRALALLYKGRLEDERGDTEAATGLLQEALEIVRRYPDEEETRRHILSSLGNCYFYSTNFQASLPVYWELYECCRSEQDKAIALQRIAAYYATQEQEDSMFIAQEEMLRCAWASRDSFTIATSLLAASAMCQDYERMDLALPYARRALAYAPAAGNVGNYAANVGLLLLDTGAAPDSIMLYLDRALNDTAFDGKSLIWSELAEWEAGQGHYQPAYAYLRKYANHMDSLFYLDQHSEVEQLIHEYDIKMQVQEERMKGQRRSWRNIGMAGICFFGAVFYFQYKLGRKRQQQKLNEQQLRQAYDKLQGLQTTIRDNQAIISLLKQEQQTWSEEKERKESDVRARELVIEKLLADRKALQDWLFRQSDVYRKIQRLCSERQEAGKAAKVLDATSRARLRDVVWNIYAARIEDLHARYPRLVEDDILLLCLQETSLDAKTIALCFGYESTRPINQRRLRIKERMQGGNGKVLPQENASS